MLLKSTYVAILGTGAIRSAWAHELALTIVFGAGLFLLMLLADVLEN